MRRSSNWRKAPQIPPHESIVSGAQRSDRKSTRLNSSHSQISYAVFCLKKKRNNNASYVLDGKTNADSIRAAGGNKSLYIHGSLLVIVTLSVTCTGSRCGTSHFTRQRDK